MNSETKANAMAQNSPTHSTHLGVECPQCHLRQFVGIHLENPLEDSPLARELRAQLEAWMASHCPDHLNVLTQYSRN